MQPAKHQECAQPSMVDCACAVIRANGIYAGRQQLNTQNAFVFNGWLFRFYFHSYLLPLLGVPSLPGIMHLSFFIALDEYCSCKYLSFCLGIPFYWNGKLADWMIQWASERVKKWVRATSQQEINIIRNISGKCTGSHGKNYSDANRLEEWKRKVGCMRWSEWKLHWIVDDAKMILDCNKRKTLHSHWVLKISSL